MLKTPLKAVDEIPEVPEVVDFATTDIPIPEGVRCAAEFGLDDLDDKWSADKAVGDSFLGSSSVDKMLASSVKPATARKYSRICDKWVAFAASHWVEIMPPDVRALEIFIADSVVFLGSSGVALTAVASVAHFSALQEFGSPCEFPRFGKLLRGICLTDDKAAKPKIPFMTVQKLSFMSLARSGTLLEWREALPLALCFQQVLRGAECFDLNGLSVTQHADFFRVKVKTLKNHPWVFVLG
jgi:hypothetical protein